MSRQDTEATTVLSYPLFNRSNISVTKTDVPDPVTAGSLLNYTINVTSNGNGTAYNVTVNDTYPSQVWYVSSEPTPVAGTNNTWVLGNLTPGTLVQINISVNVSINVPNATVITNLANVTYQNETSINLTNFATAQTTINNPLILNTSNISITKSDSPDPVEVNSTLNYTIIVTSNGDGTAYNVTLNDTYPEQVIYISAQPTPEAGSNNSWILGNMSAGTTIAVNISVLTLNVTNGTIINNTVNASFQNASGALFSAGANESTTIVITPPTPPAPPTPGGGSAGGGIGGVRRNTTTEKPGPTVCVENWICDDWSQCSEGVQTRECVDQNACGTARFVPKTSTACKMPAISEEEKPLEIKMPSLEPAINLFKAHLWPIIFIVLGLLLLTFTYWRVSQGRKPEEGMPRGPVAPDRRRFYGRVGSVDRRIDKIEREPERLEPEKPHAEEPIIEKAPEPVPVPLIKHTKKFYSRLDEIDKKLARLNRTKKNLAMHIARFSEEKCIEKELERLARGKYKAKPAKSIVLPKHAKTNVEKPKAVQKLVEKQKTMPKQDIAELPQGPKKPKTPTIKEIEAKAAEKFRMKKPRESGRFYGKMKDLDKELDRLDQKLARKKKSG